MLRQLRAGLRVGIVTEPPRPPAAWRWWAPDSHEEVRRRFGRSLHIRQGADRPHEKSARLVRLLARRESLRPLVAAEFAGRWIPRDDGRDPRRTGKREVGVREQHPRSVSASSPVPNVHRIGRPFDCLGDQSQSDAATTEGAPSDPLTSPPSPDAGCRGEPSVRTSWSHQCGRVALITA